MLLATRSSAKTFSLVVKQAGSIPNSFYGNRRSEVPKKNGIPAKGGAEVESRETTALRKISLKLGPAFSGE
jgi:hypothetical protein